MKLGVGTVQFGLDYGISNDSGITESDEVAKILSEAEKRKIQVLDTAAAYGESERVLGKLIGSQHSFRIVTKTLPASGSSISSIDMSNIENRLESSYSNLNQTTLYAILVHHAENLLVEGGEKLFELLQTKKSAGKVSKIGVSLYTEEELEALLEKYPVEIVQLPLNVLDQKFLKNGWLKELKKRNIEVHVRSAFLQGLLLMDPNQFSSYFDPIKALMLNYHRFLSENNLDPVTAALGFVNSIQEVDSVICGVNNLKQFVELTQVSTIDNLLSNFQSFAVDNKAMITPSLWQV